MYRDNFTFYHFTTEKTLKMIAFRDPKPEFAFGLPEYNLCILVGWFVLFCGVAECRRTSEN
jgi:hypothetical protein